VVHYLAEGHGFFFEHRRLTHYDDRLSYVPGLKREAQVENIAHMNHDLAADKSLESHGGHGYVVLPRLQQRRRGHALVIRLEGAHLVALQ
jgi:hypothetical protein